PWLEAMYSDSVTICSCHGRSSAYGVITSPNYPQDYAPNLNCSWHVSVTSGFIIAVHFEQPFQVKNEDTSCSLGDYVEVRLLARSPNPQSY
uniref:CUB domain-containing protein n=1 Tax=Strigops habroptila TaxID=2489341 RepID=A0A672TWH3_STRHB